MQVILYLVATVVFGFVAFCWGMFGWAVVDRLGRIKKIRADEWWYLPMGAILAAIGTLLIWFDVSGVAESFYGKAY